MRGYGVALDRRSALDVIDRRIAGLEDAIAHGGDLSWFSSAECLVSVPLFSDLLAVGASFQPSFE